MTNIIAFKPDRDGKGLLRSEEPRGQILFFTGVRYVRDDAPEIPVAPEASRTVTPTMDATMDLDVERLKA